jgi:hypothetical protein
VIPGKGEGDFLLLVKNFDKGNLEIFWFKDEFLEGSANLPPRT